MINNLNQSALLGIQRNTQGMVRSATEIARATKAGEQSNMTRALVELQQHEHAAKANIKTLATGEKLLGSLLDVKA